MPELPTMSALWIGGALTWLERLCLKSWVDAGHQMVLYTYDGVDRVPEGVEVRDASVITPGDNLYRHGRTGSIALFSDLFRFHLMRKAPGEIWIDTDIYCWRQFTPDAPHVFGYETPRQINGAVLGLPPDSEALGQMLEFTEDEYPMPEFLSPKVLADYREKAEAGTPVHVSEMPWGVWGPLCVTHFLKKTGEAKFAKPMEVFYPVHYRDRNVFFKRPVRTLRHITDDTITVHLWARIKKFAGVNFGGYPPEGSFIARRMEMHGLDPKFGRVVSHGKMKFDHTPFDENGEQSVIVTD